MEKESDLRQLIGDLEGANSKLCIGLRKALQESLPKPPTAKPIQASRTNNLITTPKKEELYSADKDEVEEE